MNDYEKNANKIAKKHNLTLKIMSNKFDYHFADDIKNRTKRYIYRCKLQCGKKSYTFSFGASLADPREPTMYDVLSCMTKYKPDIFESFCWEFGYCPESYKEMRETRKIYRAVCDEYEGFSGLFDNGEIPEDILEIC